MKCWALVALAFSLTACTTTGDPTQGGLFGWSEAKARERQAELARQADAAKQNSVDAQRQTQALTAQRDGLEVDATRQRRALDQLLTENADLDTRLRSLMEQHNLGASELARLQKVVTENDRLRRSLVVATPRPAAPIKAPTTAEVNSVGDQNSRLHREIMILMQR